MSDADRSVAPSTSTPRSSSRATSRRPLPLIAAAVVGVIIGVAATLAVTAAVGGDESDLDLACTLVGRLQDSDAFAGDVDPPDIDRLLAAGGLFLAAGGGDRDSELDQLGGDLRAGVARADEDQILEALGDAGDYCADH